MNVFLVNHRHSEACGVWQFGNLIARIVAHSQKHQFINIEANSVAELWAVAEPYGTPDVVIYNYHEGVLRWAKNPTPGYFWPGVPFVGTVHEGCPNPSIVLGDEFPFWIWHDPSIVGRPDIPDNLFLAVRPLPTLIRPVEPEPGTLGTFGFPIAGKGFEQVICHAFDNGLKLRMLLPDCWYFGEGESERQRAYLRKYADAIPGRVEIDTTFRSPEEVVIWLAGNETNALLNPLNQGRGISSSLDFLIAAGRPMLLSDSTQFRHVHRFFGYDDSDSPLPARHTYDPLPLQMAWHPNQLVLDYERMVDTLTAGGKR